MYSNVTINSEVLLDQYRHFFNLVESQRSTMLSSQKSAANARFWQGFPCDINRVTDWNI